LTCLRGWTSSRSGCAGRSGPSRLTTPLWTNDILGPGNTKVYFYGGVPEADPRRPDEHPANIIWSFWPVAHPINPGETVRVSWGNPRMYAPLAVGEGASGKASGQWPLIKTKQWYQFVLRVWQPMDDILRASQEKQPWAATVTLPLGTFNVHARVFTADSKAFDSPTVRVQTQQAATAPWKVVQSGTPPPRRRATTRTSTVGGSIM
jgi:hypothetical protein